MSTLLISGSGPREITSGNMEKQRWSYNIDILHDDGGIYGIDTVVYGDGTTETTLPGNEHYNSPF